MFIFSIATSLLLNFLQNLVLTINGNNVPTDGDIRFTITINAGDEYLLGGTVAGTEYYTTVDVTIEEDDGRTLQ